MIIKDIWFSKEYDKIRNNESIKDRIMFITLGGSYSYGTNVETSDIDVRGVSLNTHSSLIGLYPFEQAVCNETDTVIYSFNKLISFVQESIDNFHKEIKEAATEGKCKDNSNQSASLINNNNQIEQLQKQNESFQLEITNLKSLLKETQIKNSVGIIIAPRKK